MTTTTNRRARTSSDGGYHRPTIADVALLAGVHRTTVSAVLNNRPNCYASAQTRQRIREAAARLDYRPSALARGLVGKRTHTLGLIVTGFDVEMTSRKIAGFEDASRRSGRITYALNTNNRPELEDQAIRGLLDRGVDAIAIYPTEHGEHRELRKLVERRYPVVTFDGVGRLDFAVDDVSVDSFEAGRLMGQHLLDCGRRQIALVSFRPGCYVNELKAAGVESAMSQAGLKPTRLVLNAPAFAANVNELDEFEQLRPILREHKGRFDAVACVGDLAALAVMRIAADEGVRIPDDLAVMGIDGLVASGQGVVPLSTVWHDSEHVGRLALELLDERLSGKRSADDVRQVKVRPEVRTRASTLGIRK